jgi:hypothetical protein
MTIYRPQIQNWSYNHDPANSDLDAVRFLVTDTNHEDKLLDDNEINWLLSQCFRQKYVRQSPRSNP